LAKPKSSTLAWPRLVTKIFVGLMSRCTIPLPRAVSSAEAICFASSNSVSVSSGRPAIRCCSVCPSPAEPQFARPCEKTTVEPSLLLRGTAYDLQDGVLRGNALTWCSNLEEKLGEGSPLQISLKPGQHVVTLTATNSHGLSASHQISVTVTAPENRQGLKPTIDTP
jgi:hypothetical protein